MGYRDMTRDEMIAWLERRANMIDGKFVPTRAEAKDRVSFTSLPELERLFAQDQADEIAMLRAIAARLKEDGA